MNLPAHIRQTAAVPMAVEELSDRPEQSAKTQVDSAVIVHSEIGARANQISDSKVGPSFAGEGPCHPPSSHRFDERSVVERFARFGEPSIERAIRPIGSKVEHVVR